MGERIDIPLKVMMGNRKENHRNEIFY